METVPPAYYQILSKTMETVPPAYYQILSKTMETVPLAYYQILSKTMETVPPAYYQILSKTMETVAPAYYQILSKLWRQCPRPITIYYLDYADNARLTRITKTISNNSRCLDGDSNPARPKHKSEVSITEPPRSVVSARCHKTAVQKHRRLHSFLPSTADGGKRSASSLGRFTPEERAPPPGTH
jgi:hypothetical protein